MAALYGHLEVVELLLTLPGIQVNGVSDVPSRDWYGTPLHAAAQGGHVEIVKQLLRVKDIQVNAVRARVGATYLTPLYDAAEAGHVEIVKLLWVLRVFK